jgi:glycosyltransferase involved in cell wall biosynthesis
MLSPSFHPKIGGVEKHVKRVAEELTKLGEKVTVVTVDPGGVDAESETLNGVQILRIPSNRRKHIWKWLCKRRKLISEADAIHCHDYVTFYSWYLPFRILYFWKPTFVTFHGFEGYPPHPRTIRRRKICERASTGHICIGKYIGKWYGTECSVMQWGGVDNPHPGPDLPQSKEDAVAFVGRLESDTGILEYVEGLDLVKNKRSDEVRMFVCGSGSLLERLKRSEHALDLGLAFRGRVDDPLPYYQRCKYAFVSGYLAILEAMISKALVFSIFDNPLKEDYLKMMPNYEDTMIVCSSPEDLADKFIRMRENPELREKIVSRAYQFAEKLTWERVAKEYLELYGRRVDDKP